jgi:hypothetical protein
MRVLLWQIHRVLLLPSSLSMDARVSGHLRTFTPSISRRVPTYCSSCIPEENAHIWPNPSRLVPLVGALN